jgi:hypothetical protein
MRQEPARAPLGHSRVASSAPRSEQATLPYNPCQASASGYFRHSEPTPTWSGPTRALAWWRWRCKWLTSSAALEDPKQIVASSGGAQQKRPQAGEQVPCDDPRRNALRGDRYAGHRPH